MDDQITVKWKDEEAKVSSSMAFEIADAVEQHLTVGELAVMRSYPGQVKYVKLARAYAALLRVVGIRASAHEVHLEFTKALRSGKKGENRLAYAVQVMDWLLYILMDGAPEPEVDEVEEPKGEDDEPKK